MKTSNKAITAAASALLVVGTLGVYSAANAEPADPAQPLSAADAISVLEENKAEVESQQVAEMRSAQTSLALPQGATWGPGDDFSVLDEQIAELKASLASSTSRNKASTVDEPLVVWYEDGFFASLAAIDWRCAWLSTGIVATNEGDKEGLEQAVSQLRSFSESDLAIAFPDYDYFLKAHVDPLLTGSTVEAEEALAGCAPGTTVDAS